MSKALLNSREMTYTTPSTRYKESVVSQTAISQAYFGLGKSMLPVPKHILVLHMLENGFHEVFLCNLPRDCREAD